MIVEYRIYDATDRNILANSISSLEQAQEILHFLSLDLPNNTLAIEKYTKSLVKPGFGRDPDLH